MSKITKENNKEIKEKLEFIGLDLENIPKCLMNTEKVSYKPIKSYEDNNYKVYKYIDVKEDLTEAVEETVVETPAEAPVKEVAPATEAPKAE